MLEADDDESIDIQEKIENLQIESQKSAMSRITGWSDFYDDDGNEFEFNKKNLDYISQSVPIFQALDQGQYKATGAKLKN